MARFTTRTEVLTRRIYVLPSPTNLAEVFKVLAAIRQSGDVSAEHDDSVTVEAYDDEIRFSYQIVDRVV